MHEGLLGPNGGGRNGAGGRKEVGCLKAGALKKKGSQNPAEKITKNRTVQK